LLVLGGRVGERGGRGEFFFKIFGGVGEGWAFFFCLLLRGGEEEEEDFSFFSLFLGLGLGEGWGLVCPF